MRGSSSSEASTGQRMRARTSSGCNSSLQLPTLLESGAAETPTSGPVDSPTLGATPSSASPRYFPTAEQVVRRLAPTCSPAVFERMRREGVVTHVDLACLDKDDLRELGLVMIERSRVLAWSRQRQPHNSVPGSRRSSSFDTPEDAINTRLPEWPMQGAMTSPINAFDSVPSGMSPLRGNVGLTQSDMLTTITPEEDSKELQLHLDEVEQQADFWCKLVDDVRARELQQKVAVVADSLKNEGARADLSNMREDLLDKFFDLSPERLKEVYDSIDKDSDGRIIKDEVHDGLLRCELHGLEPSLEKVLTKLSPSDRLLQLRQFESMITRLKLAELLTTPGGGIVGGAGDSCRGGGGSVLFPSGSGSQHRSASVTVLDYNAQQAMPKLLVNRSGTASVGNSSLRSFFFGHRSNEFRARWVHMSGFDLTLLLALTVKYQLHPLGVEDVIEQSPTKLDRYGVHYFTTIEHLSLVENALCEFHASLGPVRVRARHVSIFCAGPPKTDTLLTIAQADRSFARDWPGEVVLESAGKSHNDSWVESLKKRLIAVRSRLRERKADFLLYQVVDLCADDLLRVVDAYRARILFLEQRMPCLVGAPETDKSGWINEVVSIKLQLGVVARRLRGLQRLIKRLADDRDLFQGAKGYMEDVADHVNESYEDAMYFVEKCGSMASGFERQEDRRQEKQHQRQVYSSSLRDEDMNRSLSILTIITCIFTPITFVAGVYGMNFQDPDTQAPTIPELLSPDGYVVFWIGVGSYLILMSIGCFWWYCRLTRRAKTDAAPPTSVRPAGVDLQSPRRISSRGVISCDLNSPRRVHEGSFGYQPFGSEGDAPGLKSPLITPPPSQQSSVMGIDVRV